jgi:DNA-binding NtrC family response regulator
MTIKEVQEKFGIIGRSKSIKDLVDITMQVSQSDISVLIYGESGVGKEVFANAIHGCGKRADKKLVSVNCGAIPEGILESELFGHEKGAFTGAVDSRKGYFEIADGGTLFLDEIAEMPLTTQVKLLRVLETKEFMRIGSESVTKVDVRIIAASNKDLQNEVDAKRFRNDLYFRLKAVSLNIPPLRKRREDVVALTFHFLQLYSKSNNIPEPEITPEALNLLMEFNWPGNIRELKNAIETAVALNRTGVLTVESFNGLLEQNYKRPENRNLPIHVDRTPDSVDREMIYRALIDLKKDLIDLKEFAYGNNNYFNNSDNDLSPKEVIPLDEMEKKAIINALKFTKWNKRKASQLLKISERTLHRKLKEYEIS